MAKSRAPLRKQVSKLREKPGTTGFYSEEHLKTV